MSDLPPDVLEEAKRLTRLARRSRTDAAVNYRERRDELLAEHDYVARVRDDTEGPTLVCHPADWLDGDGTVRLDRPIDTEEAEEVPLSPRDNRDDWEDVESHNREIVGEVRTEYGPLHGKTASAFADFMGNHYSTRIDEASAAHVEEFRSWYFPRNAWPSPEQVAALDETLEYVFEVAGEPGPID
ncbi:MAG: DUF7108 family protein [Halodesulfurarchaeum sp.]